jgi:hypothetical protein
MTLNNFARGLFGLAVLLLIAYAFSGFEFALPEPREQKELVETLSRQAREYSSAKANDFRQNAVWEERQRTLCALGASRVEGWIGRVHSVRGKLFATDSNASLSVYIGKDIRLETYAADIPERYNPTTIQKGTKLFDTVSKLKERDRIKFSGQFVAREADHPTQAGCAIEVSITRDGGMSEPQLIFRFAEVAPP